MATPGFPKEILMEPVEARLAYFEKDVVIAHPRLVETHNTLLRAIQGATDASLVFLYGPTGVGKTTLRLRVQNRLIETVLPCLKQDPERIPVAGLEVVSPGSGNFSWKDYYKRALEALSEPLTEYKIERKVPDPDRDDNKRRVIKQGTEPALRQALEECLRHRRPVAFFNDEAQHFKKVSGARRLLDQMDAIKSLSSVGQTLQVLIGTYELLDLTNLSGQLSRRSHKIHFARYRIDSAEDMKAFKSVLLTFQRYLPLAEEPDLVKDWEYLYEGCLGCVGVLKDWLCRSLSEALQDGEKTLARRHLEKCANSTHEWVSMAQELKEGEERLSGRVEKEHQAQLREFLMGAHRPQSGKDKQQQDSTPLRSQKGRVGQRKPERDKVGG
jgi:hypothetical protein